MDFFLNEDQQKLQDMVEEFAREEVSPNAEQRDRDAAFPTELFLKMSGLGIPAIPHDPEYGGLGMGTFEMVLAIEQLARVDQSLAVSTMVSTAVALTLSRFGSVEQKEKWLRPVVAGTKLASLGGTEPQAGSDTAGFKTRADQHADGTWTINGEKAFITNAGTDISSFTMAIAKAAAYGSDEREFTLFLVPAGTPGFEAGKSYNKMGWRSSDTRPLHFTDCKVPDDFVVGKVGAGRYITHKGFQQGRAFLGACSLGLAQGCLDLSVAYAKERQAFGASLGKLALIQDMIAQIAIRVAAARMLVYRAAWLADHDKAELKDLAIAKYYATEIGTECANLAVQVHGGWGFMDDCPVSRYLRDNRVCTIGDGSSQIQTLLIARELGLEVEFN